MALGATVYTFKIELADSDRGVYAPLDLRVARHPSETQDHLLTRVLAYSLEYTEGIGFSNGLSDSDQPAISVRDLTGALRVWIDVGAPEAARLHRAAKLAAHGVRAHRGRSPRVFVHGRRNDDLRHPPGGDWLGAGEFSRCPRVRSDSLADGENSHTVLLRVIPVPGASRIPSARWAAKTSGWIRCGRATAIRTTCRGRKPN